MHMDILTHHANMKSQVFDFTLLTKP